MKRKFSIVLIAVLLMPAAVFAGDFVDLQVGVSALFGSEVSLSGDLSFDPGSISVDDFFFGGDLRLSVSIFELSAMVFPVSYGEYEDYYYVTGLAVPSIGISLDLLGLVDVAVSVATVGEFAATTNGFFQSSFSNLEYVPLAGKLTADVNLGPVSVGGFLLVITDTPLGALIDPNFDPGAIDLPSTGWAGLTAVINLL